MYDNQVVTGIVLDTSLIKEYDRRLVILTVEMGRITVFANGARRKNSPLTAPSQKFVMGSFTVRPSGREAYSLISAEVKETFLEISYDIEKLAYASYACEVAGYFTREGIGAADELNLLYMTFKAILSDKFPLKLIRSTFECKLMDIEGMGLQMEACIKSGSLEGLHHLSLEDGGIVSDSILSTVKNPIYISDEAIYTIRFILSRKISALYSFNVNEQVLDELDSIMSKYIKLHSDKHFRSLDILADL